MENLSPKNTTSKTVPKPGAAFILLLPLAAALCVVLPSGDENILQLLGNRWFYIPLLGTYFVAFWIFQLINRISWYLDKRYAWQEAFSKRLLAQVVLGWILPSCLAFISSWLYFVYLEVNIMDTLYSKHIFPLVVLIILLLNIIFCGYYYIWQLTQLETNRGTNAAANYTEAFMLFLGSRLINVRAYDLAYFYRNDDDVLVRDFDQNIYVFPESLDDVGRKLNPEIFCRISRSFIIHRKAFKSVQKRADGGLTMTLEPDARREVNVSREKAKWVLEWLKKDPASTKKLS